MDSSPFSRLPEDVFFLIFSMLFIPEIMNCRSVCKDFYFLLNSRSFFQFLSKKHTPLSFQFLALGSNNFKNLLYSNYCLHVFNPDSSNSKWGFFDLSFLPYRFPKLIASSGEGRLYLWGECEASSSRTLLVCNPVTKQYKPLPKLGSAWTKFNSKVVVGLDNQVMVLTSPAAMCLSSSTWSWTNIALNFRLKLKSPILFLDSIVALCNVGTLEIPEWKLYKCMLKNINPWRNDNWVRLGQEEWAYQFENISWPRLLRGKGNKLLMIGAYRGDPLRPQCCTDILIKRLDLDTLEWEQVAAMPICMLSTIGVLKLKVYGGGDRVVVGTRRRGMLVMWDGSIGRGGKWSWIDNKGSGTGDGYYHGFMYEPNLQPLY